MSDHIGSPSIQRLRQLVGTRRSTAELVFNRILTHVPWNTFRLGCLRLLGMHAGPKTYLFGGSEFIAPENLSIAGNCHIGRFCQVDARGGISIGQDVVIASHTLLITADHDPNAPGFDGRTAPIVIHNRVWLATRVTVIKGVVIGEGAVVAAGSVVNRDVPPWTIVSGVPAVHVGTRSSAVNYAIDQGPEFY